jgi:transcriptional regulator with XRE-family HTH domain
MSYREYIAERERRSPEFRALREANRARFEFQLALVRARLNAGLTQKQLADRIGKPQSSVARWENGTNIPKLETLRLLSEALGVDFRVTKDGVAVEELDRAVLT